MTGLFHVVVEVVVEDAVMQRIGVDSISGTVAKLIPVWNSKGVGVIYAPEEDYVALTFGNVLSKSVVNSDRFLGFISIFFQGEPEDQPTS